MSTPSVPDRLAATTDQGQMRSPGAAGDPSQIEPNAVESLGSELLRRAQESQPALEAAWDELMASWGVHGQPVGIQRLREMFDGDHAARILADFQAALDQSTTWAAPREKLDV